MERAVKMNRVNTHLTIKPAVPIPGDGLAAHIDYCAPFFRLQSRHSIWQLSGVVLPPLLHGTI